MYNRKLAKGGSIPNGRWLIVISYVLYYSNYGPTIRMQLEAESKGCEQVLWLYGDDNQVMLGHILYYIILYCCRLPKLVQ